MGSSCLILLESSLSWIPVSFMFSFFLDNALPRHQDNSDATLLSWIPVSLVFVSPWTMPSPSTSITAMPHFQQALGSECRIFVSWQTSWPWNEVIHLKAFPPSSMPASNTGQWMTYHSTPYKGPSSSLLVLPARVKKSLETPFQHTRNYHN